jgi:hypothetical protein
MFAFREYDGLAGLRCRDLSPLEACPPAAKTRNGGRRFAGRDTGTRFRPGTRCSRSYSVDALLK